MKHSLTNLRDWSIRHRDFLRVSPTLLRTVITLLALLVGGRTVTARSVTALPVTARPKWI